MKNYVVIWRREGNVHPDIVEANSAQEAADKIRKIHVCSEILLIGNVTKEEWK